MGHERPFALRDQSLLSGARVWLSGALPEVSESSESERASILRAVSLLAREVFSRGGYIIHGSHPSFTPILLAEAKRYQALGGSRDRLMLVVSQFWSKDRGSVPLDEWRKIAVAYETPESPEGRDQSLAALRAFMAARADAIIAIGGLWWRNVPGRSGIPIEVGMAIDRGLPAFLLGGLGGEAHAFVDKNPHILGQLRNGFDIRENQRVSTSGNPDDLVSMVCDQLSRLPLVRGRSIDGASFRILALDGGGIKGTFTAAALAALEKQTGRSIVEHFDLVAGTSTGGILAIGIANSLSAEQMLSFYLERGPIIFPITRLRGRFAHFIRHLCVPKYSQSVLLRELEAAYYTDSKATRLGDARCRLVIPAYHAVAGASHVFRTPHHPILTADAETASAHAALATSAAPTYFAAATLTNMVAETSYFDGGVWANSPVMAAIIEAVCFLNVPLERIDVLSIGTTEEPFTVRGATRAGILGWLWKKRIVELLMNVQQESALKFAKQLMGTPRFLRVNTTIAPGQFRIDGIRQVKELAALGERSALEADVLSQVRSRFLNGVHAARWESYA